MNFGDIYALVLKEYPDILTVDENIIITINNLIKQKMSQVYRLLSHAIL